MNRRNEMVSDQDIGKQVRGFYMAETGKRVYTGRLTAVTKAFAHIMTPHSHVSVTTWLSDTHLVKDDATE